jgi:hypothetical protein
MGFSFGAYYWVWTGLLGYFWVGLLIFELILGFGGSLSWAVGGRNVSGFGCTIIFLILLICSIIWSFFFFISSSFIFDSGTLEFGWTGLEFIKKYCINNYKNL